MYMNLYIFKAVNFLNHFKLFLRPYTYPRIRKISHIPLATSDIFITINSLFIGICYLNFAINKIQLFLRAGLKTLPHNAKMHYNWANYQRDVGDTQTAVNHYREALR